MMGFLSLLKIDTKVCFKVLWFLPLNILFRFLLSPLYTCTYPPYSAFQIQWATSNMLFYLASHYHPFLNYNKMPYDQTKILPVPFSAVFTVYTRTCHPMGTQQFNQMVQLSKGKKWSLPIILLKMAILFPIFQKSFTIDNLLRQNWSMLLKQAS